MNRAWCGANSSAPLQLRQETVRLIIEGEAARGASDSQTSPIGQVPAAREGIGRRRPTLQRITVGTSSLCQPFAFLVLLGLPWLRQGTS